MKAARNRRDRQSGRHWIDDGSELRCVGAIYANNPDDLSAPTNDGRSRKYLSSAVSHWCAACRVKWPWRWYRLHKNKAHAALCRISAVWLSGPALDKSELFVWRPLRIHNHQSRYHKRAQYFARFSSPSFANITSVAWLVLDAMELTISDFSINGLANRKYFGDNHDIYARHVATTMVLEMLRHHFTTRYLRIYLICWWDKWAVLRSHCFTADEMLAPEIPHTKC